MITYQLADLFEAVADEVPDRVAVVADDQRLTFRELDERSTRLANHLVAAGLQPGAKVGIYAWNRAEWVEAMLGAFKARLVPVNINYRYVAHELTYLFDNADLEALVVERQFLPVVADVAPSAPLLRHILVLEDGSDADATGMSGVVAYEDALAGASPGRAGIERSSEDLYLLYTGGTTGMPKGVMWSHEDIFFAAMGGNAPGQPPMQSPDEIVDRINPEPTRRVNINLAPLMHGAAQWNMFITLFVGGQLTLYTGRSFDPEDAWRIAEQERCTALSLVGDAMARPLADALDRKPNGYDLSSLVSIGSGGAIFSKSVKQQLLAHLPSILLIDAFGSSETGYNSSQLDPDQGLRFPRNESTEVLGGDLRPVEPGSGVVGRLARRGSIPRGYYKDDAKTAATFLVDPDGVRWAVLGDHATVEADGMVTLLGRGSFCINSGGEKIYPEEVEIALKSHPDVFDALVVGMPDERFGEKVAAIVQPREGRTPTLDDLGAHCGTLVARYKVPRHLVLVDEIGRTASGKADYAWAKRALDGGLER